MDCTLLGFFHELLRIIIRIIFLTEKYDLYKIIFYAEFSGKQPVVAEIDY